MNQTAIELRKAAASARAFAESLKSAELRRSFREMAGRWEKEADDWDTAEPHVNPSQPRRGRKVPRSQKH
jgi:hypothetical protein